MLRLIQLEASSPSLEFRFTSVVSFEYTAIGNALALTPLDDIMRFFLARGHYTA